MTKLQELLDRLAVSTRDLEASTLKLKEKNDALELGLRREWRSK